MADIALDCMADGRLRKGTTMVERFRLLHRIIFPNYLHNVTVLRAATSTACWLPSILTEEIVFIFISQSSIFIETES